FDDTSATAIAPTDTQWCIAQVTRVAKFDFHLAAVVWNKRQGYMDEAIEAMERKFLSWMVQKEVSEKDILGLRQKP
ncbi:hypothetical protein J6590_028358, partial [Homalodisca vitripennis]